MYRIVEWLPAALARLLVGTGRAKDLESVVGRHQLMILPRQIDRLALTAPDRRLLGAIATALPRGGQQIHAVSRRAPTDRQPPRASHGHGLSR